MKSSIPPKHHLLILDFMLESTPVNRDRRTAFETRKRWKIYEVHSVLQARHVHPGSDQEDRGQNRRHRVPGETLRRPQRSSQEAWRWSLGDGHLWEGFLQGIHSQELKMRNLKSMFGESSFLDFLQIRKEKVQFLLHLMRQILFEKKNRLEKDRKKIRKIRKRLEKKKINFCCR